MLKQVPALLIDSIILTVACLSKLLNATIDRQLVSHHFPTKYIIKMFVLVVSKYIIEFSKLLMILPKEIRVKKYFTRAIYLLKGDNSAK